MLRGDVEYVRHEQLVAGLDEVCRSPRGEGRVELIVRRPTTNQRELLGQAELDPEHGLIGDSWFSRTGGTPNKAQREAQITLINARLSALIAADLDRRALAGDQLHVDLDLSIDHLPPGSRLELGSAVLEISSVPHTGCSKFCARFGEEALEFVNSDRGRELRLRGVNTRVVQAGSVRVGDVVRRISVPAEQVAAGVSAT